MSTKARVLFVVGVLFLMLASLGPIWRIEIWAPQYPEGLMLQIHTDRISGNVDQINILNHYVGMKKIIPAEIRELRLIPNILKAFVLLGLCVAVLNRLALARVWLSLFLVSLGAGLIDFYLWGYDYGHNLNPDAPIQIPGLTYQPPLIGHKTLLNIDSYSLPDWGGYILACALALLAFSTLWDKLAQSRTFDEKKGPAGQTSGHKGVWRGVVSALACFFTLSCTGKPQPFEIGKDHCESCHMTIMDAHFGGEIITDKGRTYKFDSLNCMLSYYRTHRSSVHQILVSDYFHPGDLINAPEASFIRTTKSKGPMGQAAIASRTAEKLKALSAETQELVTWNELISAEK